MEEEGKKMRTTAKAQFTRAERNLLAALNAETDTWTITRRYEDLANRWNKVQDAHDAYVLTLDDTAVEAEAAWIDELANRFSEVELGVGKMLNGKECKDTPAKSEETVVESPRDDKPAIQQHSGIKLERMQFSTFKGDIRKYPEFKSEFTKYIQPQCHPEQLSFILKNHLNESVKEEVSAVSDDYEEMWNRLDMKYGNIGKLVDAILSDVKKLPPNSNSSSDVLKMINTVEKAWRDLRALGQASELYNSTTISIIEQAMTKQVKVEWVKLIASKAFDSEQKFFHLIEFLKDWRNRIEYSAADIRQEEAQPPVHRNAAVHQASGGRRNGEPPRRQRCWLHNINGPNGEHPIWKCRLFQSKTVSERKSLVSANNACTRCLMTGCPGVATSDNCSRGFSCSIQGCTGKHNSLLHEETGQVHHNLENYTGLANPLLPIQELQAL